MWKKKDTEKIKTQVLNLNEVREAEALEKHSKHAKLPKRFLILAIILILLGVLYVPVTKLIHTAKENEKITPSDKNSLTCIIENEQDKDGLEIEETIIFNFDKDSLIGYNLVSTKTLIKSDEESTNKFKEQFESLNKEYKKLNSAKGFTGTISMNSKEIIQNMTIDLEKIKQESSIITFKLNESKESIIKKETEKKAKCK